MKIAQLLLGMFLVVGALYRSLSAEPKPPPRLALLIGIGDYDQTGPRPWRRLHARRDVEELRRVLVERFGFAGKDIKVLLDREATTEGIRRAFRTHLIERAAPGAVMLFHFSGHGQQIRDDDGDELDGLDESLVTYDARSQRAEDGARTNLRDDELRSLLSELRARVNLAGRPPGSITVTLDTCYSGTGSRAPEPGLLVERGRPWDVSLDGPKPPGGYKGKGKGRAGWLLAGEAVAQGYIFLSATQSDQTAKEVGDMGVFSRALVQALQSAQGTTTYRELFEQVLVHVANGVREQIPQIEGETDLLLFRGLARPTAAHLLVTRVDGDRVTLPIGALHGASVGSRFALYRAGSDVRDAAARVAEAVVKDLDEVTCSAVLTAATRSHARELVAARAIEVEHHFDNHPVRVYVEGDNGLLRELLAGLDGVLTEGVSREQHDLRTAIDNAGNLTLTRRSAAKPFATLPMNQETKARLREILRREWRWHFVLRLDNPSSAARIDLRLVPVVAQTNAAGRVVTPPRSRTDIERTGPLILCEGDFFMLELRNRSRDDLYVSVFDLAADGAISPLFPHPAVGGDNLIPADSKPRVIPLPFVFRVKRPFGLSLVKAIVTSTKVDFSPMLQEGVALERSGELIEQMPAIVSPLARLLSAAAGGTRAAELLGIAPSLWTTSHAWYEVRLSD